MGIIFHLDASYAKLDAEQRKLLRIQKLTPRLEQWYQALEKYRTRRTTLYRIFEYGRLLN
ncbi:hypothetical protein RR47_GL001989 [Enterococcus columbae DSM 7374 = ATCC 51263]|nr:hypothetical protein RR47_GL001989 [Enterococcus columbae DSM 7374 = ATCC 51263]